MKLTGRCSRVGVAGDFVLHPLLLSSLLVLVLNDHYFKGRGPGVVTGKLSDAAGLVVAPVALAAVAAVVTARSGRISRTSLAWGSTAIIGVGFASVKAAGVIASAYSLLLTQANDAVRLGDGPSGMLVRADLTDLAALPALLIAWRLIAGSMHRAECPVVC